MIIKEDIKIHCSILLKNYNVYKSQLKSSKIQIEANKINLNVIKKQYEAGIKTFSDSD